MATTANTPDLLSTLNDSLTAAISSLPELESLAPPKDGISLLDTKNEILLAYLQHLVFLMILKLRNNDPFYKDTLYESDSLFELNDAVTKKLVELRLYLEKGIRPLESRLKYQLDKLLLAASEAAPASSENAKTSRDSAKSALRDDDEDDIDPVPPPAAVSDLSYRPNPAAFVRPPNNDHSTTKEASRVYRPPRIAPTTLPTTERKQSRPTKPRKSQTLDAFSRD